MIEVNIVGQLGNQLFEYACARQLQEIYGGEILLNTYEMRKNTPNFKLNLLDYELNENIRLEENIPITAVNAESIFVKVMRQFFPNFYFNMNVKRGVFIWKSARTYKELPQLPIKQRDHIVLNGYWQCDKYFQGIEEILRQELKPKQELLEHNKELFEKIKTTNSICVTIRRGDFMNKKNKATFYVCNEKYFEKAMNTMNTLYNDCVFFAFSDDIQWVKENIEFPGKVYYERGDDPAWEKMRLMSACKHFILSNSSFSWWAQYLSENTDKTVIAPDRWYNKGKNKKADIYQNNWKIIKA